MMRRVEEKKKSVSGDDDGRRTKRFSLKVRAVSDSSLLCLFCCLEGFLAVGEDVRTGRGWGSGGDERKRVNDVARVCFGGAFWGNEVSRGWEGYRGRQEDGLVEEREDKECQGTLVGGRGQETEQRQNKNEEQGREEEKQKATQQG